MLKEKSFDKIPSVVYVDNDPEIMLARYLDDKADAEGEFKFYSVQYKPESGYKALLNNEIVRMSDILFLDNRLFTEADGGPYLEGVEIKVFLNLLFPYKKILIVTQYDEREFNNLEYVVRKYSDEPGRDNSEASIFKFYDEHLKDILAKCIADIKYTWQIIDKIKDSDLFKDDKILIEDMVDVSNNTIPHYGRLTSEDINNFIKVISSIKC